MFKNFLILLERIAIALEAIAKVEYIPKSTDDEVKLVEAPNEELIEEETRLLREQATDLITRNPTKQIWAEDNLTDEQLESLE